MKQRERAEEAGTFSGDLSCRDHPGVGYLVGVGVSGQFRDTGCASRVEVRGEICRDRRRRGQLIISLGRRQVGEVRNLYAFEWIEGDRIADGGRTQRQQGRGARPGRERPGLCPDIRTETGPSATMTSASEEERSWLHVFDREPGIDRCRDAAGFGSQQGQRQALRSSERRSLTAPLAANAAASQGVGERVDLSHETPQT